EIFGQNFELETKDGKRNDLMKVANYYKKVIETLKKKQPNKPHLEIAVLAGLMITDDLYNLVQSRKNNDLNPETNANPEKAPSANPAADQKIDEILNQAIKKLEISLKL
ncbi:MAG: cell division protein ZapA, partial [Spirochaetes bacterium]|nr:cell division protein ZapA [Spirochaetota bacterium]